jgi:phosphatidate phosphatase APP1
LLGNVHHGIYTCVVSSFPHQVPADTVRDCSANASANGFLRVPASEQLWLGLGASAGWHEADPAAERSRWRQKSRV